MTKYTARPHAVDRALLRFGISSEYAENWFNQLMSTARHIGEEGKRQVYDHKGKRIIVQGTEIITIFNVADLPFAGKVSTVVERELKRLKKVYDKRTKELEINLAEENIEFATVKLNYLKAKSPKVKRTLQIKLGEISERLNVINLELSRMKDEYKALEMQSKGYLLTGTEAQ